jgi:hypothetical protein
MKVKRLKDKQINLSQVGKESQSSRSKVHNIKEFLREFLISPLINTILKFLLNDPNTSKTSFIIILETTSSST